MVILLKKGKSIEANHFIRNTVGTQHISDAFRDEENNLKMM